MGPCPLPMRLLALVLLCASAPADEGIEFFEKRIRPLLSQKCYTCHSAKTVTSGGLRLDTRDALLKGGSRGVAIAAGQPEIGTLLRAVSYEDPDLRMPPTGKLSLQELDALRDWVAMGAPDPREEAPASRRPEGINYERGRRFWAFQPYRAHPLPKVSDRKWPSSWIDQFILAGLEAKKLKPAPPADKRTLIRRVTFDLTGLPPTPREVGAFLADDSPFAFEKLVDRLLASPHYGERWARHWLDLARYAETDGHEFDREKPNAWRYRDYVIRAFNDDLPYDQFIREQLAGDLLPSRRMAPGATHWETPVATGFFGLHEERNAADDLAEVRAEKLDNQIDTLGRTFLGLTVVCAKCHDHKFDPISTKDYYALAGVLHGKQVIQVSLDAPSKIRETEEIAAQMEDVHRKIAQRVEPRQKALTAHSGHYLRAAVKLIATGCDPTDAELTHQATAAKLNERLLRAWVEELNHAAREPDHPLYAVAWLARPPELERTFAERLDAVREVLREWTEKSHPDHPIHAERGDLLVADFGMGSYDGFRVDGPAFGAAPVGGVASSFRAGTNEFTGILTSKSIRANGRYFHVRLAGMNDTTSRRQPGLLRVALVGDGRDVSVVADGTGRFSWKTSGMDKMPGELAYIEIVDRTKTGHIQVDKVFLSNAKEPPFLGRAPDARTVALLDGLDSFDAVLAAYERVFAEGLDPRVPLNAVLEDEAGAERAQLLALAARLPEPAYGMVSVEDVPGNLQVHIGGNHMNLGEEVPRGFLTILGGGAFQEGSGRAQLAEAIADPQNPLTTRVMVNRIWKHHFGEGLVRTVDNFGLTGERPSHPELLDTLAARFVEGGWSIKKLHRAIVLSSTYRMSSRADPKAVAVDGDNRLLHHMRVRRLEAESIRDAILAVSGGLDRTMFGEPVPPYVSPYQDGRGKPVTGPLDGDGRRSIYIGVRRNFVLPMFLAFDYPMTVTAIGRRGSSTVPSQALVLMNNEFVVKQAARWADRMLGGEPDERARIEQMFLAAYGRSADESEIGKAVRFVGEQARRYGEDGSFRAWTDLAHVLINAKEFIFVR